MIQAYGAVLADSWDAFCSRAVNATLLHQRRFLSYHGERFADASVLVLSEQRIVGVLPAAVAPDASRTLVSHPGATYGGIAHDGWLSGDRMIEAMATVRSHYAALGYETLVYKAVPHIYCSAPSQDDLYALFRMDAALTRSDLSCAIDLQARRPVSERRRRGLKKARALVTLSDVINLLPGLWAVVEGNLASRHAARPVHTLAEISELASRFPQNIRILCASIEGRVEAGIVLFNSARVWHTQYIAASERGYAVSALDAVLSAAIDAATAAGARYFDFGTSNESGGRVLNEGLYRFKSEFGGGGVAHQFLELRLR